MKFKPYKRLMKENASQDEVDKVIGELSFAGFENKEIQELFDQLSEKEFEKFIKYISKHGYEGQLEEFEDAIKYGTKADRRRAIKNLKL